MIWTPRTALAGPLVVKAGLNTLPILWDHFQVLFHGIFSMPLYDSLLGAPYVHWADFTMPWLFLFIWAPQCAIGHYLPCPGMNLYFGGTSMCALDVFIFGGTYDVPIRALLIYALV